MAVPAPRSGLTCFDVAPLSGHVPCGVSGGCRLHAGELDDPAAAQPWMIGGLVGGLVFALITIFKANWAPKTAPLYAVLEGLFLGGISATFEMRFHEVEKRADLARSKAPMQRYGRNLEGGRAKVGQDFGQAPRVQVILDEKLR